MADLASWHDGSTKSAIVDFVGCRGFAATTKMLSAERKLSVDNEIESVREKFG